MCYNIPVKISTATAIPENGYNYSIDYWNEGGGILRYSYVKEKTDARKTAEAVVAVVALTAAVVYCVPAAVPAYVSAASFALMY